jgi:hypothetical protein
MAGTPIVAGRLVRYSDVSMACGPVTWSILGMYATPRGLGVMESKPTSRYRTRAGTSACQGDPPTSARRKRDRATICEEWRDDAAPDTAGAAIGATRFISHIQYVRLLRGPSVPIWRMVSDHLPLCHLL